MHDQLTKARLRIASDVAAFVANGGEIQELVCGESAANTATEAATLRRRRKFAKLTEAQVRRIRFKLDAVSQKQRDNLIEDLAAEYRVSSSCIRKIYDRNTWRDIDV